MNKKLFYVLLLAVASLGLYKIGDNILRIGDGQSTDKQIIADVGSGATNPHLTFNATSSSWEFSNDGTTTEKFGSGSGSGSGINLIDNPGFELLTNNWTNAGSGAFSVTGAAANVGFGGSAGEWDAAANLDTLTSDVQNIPNILGNILCEAEMFYKGGDANITMQVLDGATVLNSGVLKVQSEFKPVRFSFLCPARGTVKFQLLSSADAAIIYLDQVHVGTKGASSGVAGGWKIYDSEVTLTGSTGGVWVDVYHTFQPYKDPVTDAWRLKGWFRMDLTGLGAGQTSPIFSISGIIFSGANSEDVSCNVYGLDVGVASRHVACIADATTGNIQVISISGAEIVDRVHVTFDAALASKPTWADFDNTVNLINDETVFANARGKFTLSSNKSIAADGVDRKIEFDTATIGFNGLTISATGDIIIPANGVYHITAELKDASTPNYASMSIYEGGSTKILFSVKPLSGRVSLEGSVFLNKGDVIAVYGNSAGGGNISANSAPLDTWVVIEKQQDFTAGDAVGFGLADADNAGLVPSYEEGNWIPTISATSNWSSVSYTAQLGYYIKIGNKVSVSAFIVWDNTSGVPSGGISIDGLPFPSKNVVNGFSTVAIQHDNIDLSTSAMTVMGQHTPNTTSLLLVQTSDNANAAIIDSAFNSGASSRGFIFSYTYFTE